MSLDDLQQDFSVALLDPDKPIPEVIDPLAQYDIEKRFSVYRNNVLSSLIDALRVAFATIDKLVGEEFFDAMAAVFVRVNPPRSPILALYGEAFPDFLTAFPPVEELPYLPDVARLELARRQVYHEADGISLAGDFLTQFSAEELPSVRFDLHPAHRTLSFAYPAYSIWQTNWNTTGETIDLSGLTGEDCLVYREGSSVLQRKLCPGGAQFIADLARGDTLGESAEKAGSIDGFDLADCLASIIESRLVVAAN
ncbi:HvfC/BufC N-terminal domain-containing protein [Sneathiella aquimaris]|uniref:HvfC/BufC N-terminal domain-containing protein n=1 Tax=Sneathiella aquimaris TaxID=2599305 RepID=UPI00146A97B3|nr:DNA-binding domain-containing protein [Sneathiella aquimaris]